MTASDFPSESDIESCLIADRFWLRKRLRGLRQRTQQGKPFEQGFAKVWEQLRTSQALVEHRRASLPVPEYPSELPVCQRREEIARLIANHQVVVLCGETGSGKSTQLPKICLALGRGVFGRIGHTQPRRIAARSVAARISSELGRELGTSVGYKVRFHDRVGPDSHIKLLTDGMLLAEVRGDRYLNEYDTLIIDEAHERSLNIDFLLGYLKLLLPKRPDLKLIITSATIDPQRFSAHFDNAPIIEVAGRTYPVEVRYRPPEDGGGERDEAMQQAIVDAVSELNHLDHGDVLVFLSGEREIRETAETLRHHKLQLTEILPLYARLGPKEQGRIFSPGGSRRIILATNVAETSLTVPGIRHVVDAGFARISRYSHRGKVQRLPVERISQASADQRKGRCGRVAEGVCIRLYSEEDYLARREFTEPEILRTNLASVILQMKVLGFGDIEAFPFIDPPDSRLISDGYRLLEELGALDGERRVTRLGQQLARLPTDPRIGRMLIAAGHSHCLTEVMTIAAALSIQDPRDRPLEKQQAADEIHATFAHPESDFLGFLNIWKFLEENRRHLSRRKFIDLCRNHFLSWNRVQEWQDIRLQFRLQLHEMGFHDNEAEGSYEEIHRALLSGLLSHIGMKDENREYLGARVSRFQLWPGSALFAKGPKWVMAAERVETSRQYARVVASIKPEWVESAAGHLLKRSYSEPHWQPKSGQVAAYERVTLYGLPIVPKRRINYGPVNPQVAREIFIRFALVEGDFETRAPFFRHNRELREYVEHLEHKSRRRDLLVDEEAIYQYYADRIPASIYSKPLFESWLRKASKDQPKLLHMRLADLLHPEAVEISAREFPDHLEINGMNLPLEYHFDPGHQADGVTLVVPMAVLNQVTEEHGDWLVPGLLRERIISLIKSLPKQLRRSFVPVPEYADACLKTLKPGGRRLVQAVAEQLKTMTGVHIPEDAWQAEHLPEHLRMKYRIVNDLGIRIDSDNDLARLKREHANRSAESFRSSPNRYFEQDGIRGWDFGPLPESVELRQGGISLTGFPALIDEKDSVAVRVLNASDLALVAHRAGLRRLIMLNLAADMRYLRKNNPNLKTMTLQYATAPKLAQEASAKVSLEDQLVTLIVDQAFLGNNADIRSGEILKARVDARKQGLMATADSVCKLADDILQGYQQARKALSKRNRINWMASVRDIKEQLDGLVYQGFLLATPYEHLTQLPRYLRACLMRIEKLDHAAARDQQRLAELQPIHTQWKERYQRTHQAGRHDSRLEEIRWSLEELRVSIFAQEIGTAYPISLKRLEKRWKELNL